MSETRMESIDLPARLVRALEQRVAAGDYPSMAAAIEAGLASLDDHALPGAPPEQWLTEVVLPAYDATDEQDGASAEEFGARLDRHMDAAIRRHPRSA